MASGSGFASVVRVVCWCSFAGMAVSGKRLERELRFPKGGSFVVAVALASLLPKGPTDGFAHVLEFDLGFPFPDRFDIGKAQAEKKISAYRREGILSKNGMKAKNKHLKRFRRRRDLKENQRKNLLLRIEDAITRSAAVKYNDVGLQKYLQVEFDEAIADYTRAIELDPSFAVAYYNRGTVHYRLGKYERALKDLAKAVELEPNNLEFLEALRDCQKMVRNEEDEY